MIAPMTLESHQTSRSIDVISGEANSLRRPALAAIFKGMRCRCPRCGSGKLYNAYLKVTDVCPSCDLELHHQRADDAPPYFTMFIVGHLLVPMVLIVEKLWRPEWWVHMALWGPLAIVMTLWLLPIVKGGIIGLQWAMGMHGFGEDDASGTDRTFLAEAGERERL